MGKINARLYEEGLDIMVTGTQNPDEARPAVIDRLVEYATYCDMFSEQAWWAGMTDAERAAAPAVHAAIAREWAERWTDQEPPRLVVGRNVPSNDGEYPSYWHEGLAVDKPGAIFALVYDRRDSLLHPEMAAA